MRRLYWGGYFVGCSDDGGSSKYYYLPTEDSLPAPTGNNPLKSGVYKMIIEGSEDTPLYHFVDADNLTITIRTSTKKVMGSDIMYKYTYNETAGTLTMTIYQRPFPTDTDAYLETFIGEWPSFYVGYEGDYEFYGKTDYITAERNFLLLKLKPRWDESWLSKFQMMEWEEYYNEKMEYANDVFSSSFSQDFYYNVEGDTVTLIDEEEYTYTLKFLHK